MTDSLEQYDGALLVQLEERGSTEQAEFVPYVRGIGDEHWPGPPDDNAPGVGLRMQDDAAS